MVKNFKQKAVVLFLVLFAFLAVGFMAAPPVLAQPTDLCLKLTVQENEDGPLPAVNRVTMNIHLASVNGTHFTVWGKVRSPGEPVYVGGTGILEGDVLTMNLTSSQKHTDAWRESGVVQARLNVATGRGTFFEVANSFDTQNRVFDPRYSAGIMRVCP